MAVPLWQMWTWDFGHVHYCSNMGQTSQIQRWEVMVELQPTQIILVPMQYHIGSQEQDVTTIETKHELSSSSSDFGTNVGFLFKSQGSRSIHLLVVGWCSCATYNRVPIHGTQVVQFHFIIIVDNVPGWKHCWFPNNVLAETLYIKNANGVTKISPQFGIQHQIAI